MYLQAGCPQELSTKTSRDFSTEKSPVFCFGTWLGSRLVVEALLDIVASGFGLGLVVGESSALF